MNYDILQKRVLKSILDNRDWVNILKKFKITIEDKYFINDKYKLIFNEIVKTEGNTIELKKSISLIQAKVDINNLFPEEPLFNIVDSFQAMQTGYNETKFFDIVNDSTNEIKKGKELNQVLINTKQEIDNLVKSEVVNDYSMKLFLANKYEEDMNRTSDIIGYKLNRMKGLEKSIAGVQNGFIIIGAPSNAGKSICLNQIEVDLIESNKEVFILKFSLDDTKEDCINTHQSILSKGVLTRNDIKTPRILKDQYRYLTDFSGSHNTTTEKNVKNVYGNVEARDEYDKSLHKMVEYADSRIKIFDSSTIESYSHLEIVLKRYLELYKDKKLVVTIDGIMNLDIQAYLTVKDNISMHDTRANLLKRLADVYKIPLLVTTEVRKTDGSNGKFREPIKADLKHSNKYDFNAKLVLLLSHNEAHWTNENVVYNKMIIAKNKFAQYKNPLYYELKRAEGYMTFDSKLNNENEYYCEDRYNDSIREAQPGVKTR